MAGILSQAQCVNITDQVWDGYVFKLVRFSFQLGEPDATHVVVFVPIQLQLRST